MVSCILSCLVLFFPIWSLWAGILYIIVSISEPSILIHENPTRPLQGGDSDNTNERQPWIEKSRLFLNLLFLFTRTRHALFREVIQITRTREPWIEKSRLFLNLLFLFTRTRHALFREVIQITRTRDNPG